MTLREHQRSAMTAWFIYSITTRQMFQAWFRIWMEMPR